MPRRIAALQDVMRAKGIGAALFTGMAGPGLFGVAKYFSNLSLWYGKAYVVVGANHPEPAIIHWSGFQAAWNRQEATTAWIETPDVAVALGSLAAFDRALEIALELCGSDRRLGVENLPQTWSAGEIDALRSRHPTLETVDLAREVDAIRSIKSPFELAEIRTLGELMTGAIDRFSELAKPGLPIWHASSAAEAFLKAEGCAWGRVKMSLNEKPATILPRYDRLFEADDTILLEIDYSGPFGHWYEMTGLLSFRPLTERMQAKVDAYADVIDRMIEVMAEGTPVGRLATVADQRFEQLGYAIVGMHLPHAHSIGLDECDGPNSSATPDDILRTDMVLAVHPGGIFVDGTGFAFSDSFRVTQVGGERLSSKTWLHRQLG
jgi:Xaa-Pro aminopeptidase